MSRTIEAIMRHMASPASRATHPRNGVEKLEKEITVQKRHHIWAESRFVRTMLPFHSNVRVGYNGTEVDGKSVLDLMTLAPPEGTRCGFVSKDPMRQRQCTLSINLCNRALTVVNEPLRDYRDATFSERLRLTRRLPLRIARTSRWLD